MTELMNARELVESAMQAAQDSCHYNANVDDCKEANRLQEELIARLDAAEARVKRLAEIESARQEAKQIRTELGLSEEALRRQVAQLQSELADVRTLDEWASKAPKSDDDCATRHYAVYCDGPRCWLYVVDDLASTSEREQLFPNGPPDADTPAQARAIAAEAVRKEAK